MFRAEALLRLGGYADPDWPEDYDLYLRADAAGMQMGKPAWLLLRWREHARRLTRTDHRYDLQRFQAAKAHYLSNVRLPGQARGDLGRRPRWSPDARSVAGRRQPVTGFLEVHPRRIGGQKRGLPVWPLRSDRRA